MSGEKQIEDMTDAELAEWAKVQHQVPTDDGQAPLDVSSVTLRTWEGKRGWVFHIVEGTPWREVRELVTLAFQAETQAQRMEGDRARKFPEQVRSSARPVRSE